MVPAVQGKEKKGMEFLSALQLAKGFKKGEVTNMRTLREEEGGHEAPLEIKSVLK